MALFECGYVCPQSAPPLTYFVVRPLFPHSFTLNLHERGLIIVAVVRSDT